jgi:hypothetical protein
MLVGTTTLGGVSIKRLTRGSQQKVLLRCDQCGKETITWWGNYIQYQEKTQRNGKTYCQSCATKIGGVKRKGRKAPHTAKRNSSQVGKNHPSWRGGQYVDANGYRMVNVRSGRRKSGWGNYKKEHILVVERNIGRKILKSELVHHVDGVKLNNHISNLFLTDSSGHRNAHVSLQDIGYELVRSKLVKFSKKTGKYSVADVKLRELLGHPKMPSGIGQSAAKLFRNEKKVQRLGHGAPMPKKGNGR